MNQKQKTTKNLKTKNRSKLFVIFAIAVVLPAGFWLARSSFVKSRLLEGEKKSLPEATKTISTSVSKTISNQPIETTTVTPIPDELNLDVPFTAQAPTANWDKTHEEACEEVAILMVSRYFAGREISSPADAEKGLQEIIAWEKQNLGFFESTTVGETVKVINGIDGDLQTEIIENPTIDEIKNNLADGKLILVPTAGRLLGNPFYKSPGPLYHMLVIKGYTKTQFITNDGGTRRGENYPYNFKTVLDANHDWNGGDVASGKKLMIVVSK